MTNEDSDLQAVLTLLRGSSRANEFRTSETIAIELGLPIESVALALKRLEAAGRVRRVGLEMWAST